MGWNMALNVRKKMPRTATLFVHDVFMETCDKFALLCSEIAEVGPVLPVESSKEAATRANTVISIVPAAKDVRNVYLDQERGVIAAPKSEKRLMLECSTIDSQTTREVGKALMDAGLGTYVDTPVSGGSAGAAAGILAFMMGCSESDAHAGRVKEAVAMMGDPKKQFCCGAVGTGLAAKISNNYMSGIINVAMAETMAIGLRSGVDPTVLHEVIKNSSGMSWMGLNKQPVPHVVPAAASSNSYRPGFRVELMIKDLSLGVEAGEITGINPTIAKAALETYHKANEDERCKVSHGRHPGVPATDRPQARDVSSLFLFITDTDDTAWAKKAA